jgi:hypothetical protein
MNAERFESFVMVRTHLTNAKRALHSAAAACPTACGRLRRDIHSLERLADSLFTAANNCVQINRPDEHPSDQRAGEAPVHPAVGRMQDKSNTTKQEGKP